MGNRSVTPSKRRRRLLIATCVVLVTAVTTWLLWPRIDPRFVGTWTDGEHLMVIGSDGYADSFFVQWRDESEGPIPLFADPNGNVLESRPVMNASAVRGRIRFRTSGNHFQVAIPHYQTNTITGLLKYFLALLKGERTEELFCEGTVASISDDAMTLELELTLGAGVNSPGSRPKGSMKYHRVKDDAEK
jgi:hypothetical protein